MINKYFDKIYIITLEGSDRHKNLKLKIDFDFETFFGVDGRYIDKKDSIWTHGQMGCTMSHIKLYKHIIDNNIQSVLILEDDAIMQHNISNISEYMSQLPTDWGMLYLGWRSRNISPNHNKNWFKMNMESFRIIEGTHAIALQLDFVKQMYEFNKNCIYTADGAYTEIVKQMGKDCYLVTPKVFDNDNSPSLTEEVDKYMRGDKNTIFKDE